tara:strand:- start:7 stop:300 length:294 start_codon:yes stop_codon:yes gene_type:complete
VLDVTAVFQRPKRMIWKRRPMKREPHYRRPDLDNVIKAICDAVQASGIIDDDGAICAIQARKCYASGDESPHVAIVLRWAVPEAGDDEERRVVEGEG